MLEQPEVLLRRPQKDRHLVERHAALGLVEHAPDDLDRFASLARRRKQPNVAGALAQRRPLLREDVTAEVGQVGQVARVVWPLLNGDAQIAERRSGDHVAIGNRRQHVRRAAGNRRHEFALRLRVERDVQKNDGQTRPAHLAIPNRRGGQPEKRRAIVNGDPIELGLDAREQPADIAGRRVAGAKTARADAREAELVNGARERLWEARHRRDGREVLELTGRDGVEDRPRGNSLCSALGGRRVARPGQARAGGARGQFGEAEPRQSKRRARAPTDVSDEIIGGSTRRADDDRFGRGRKLCEELPRRFEPDGSGRGRDGAQHGGYGPAFDSKPGAALRPAISPRS